MTLHTQHFYHARDLTDFVNSNNILRANILKIDADAANGGWNIFWWA